ncbi:MAG TPA: glycerophosphoryl diester phosphodiesterase membrane domain-containing protein [Chloroflexia bacterium]|nr:glycerophosphoryl diester phosphodiesterase membrane domain-containing protein [Chloroflexia bacterium]
MLAKARELSTELIISRLRQRSIGEIIDQAFRLYRRHFLTFLAISVVAYVPVQIAFQAIDGAIAVARLDAQRTGVFGSTLLSLYSQGSSILYMLSRVLIYLSQAALTLAIASIYLDREVSVGDAYRQLRERIRPVLGLTGLLVLIWLGAASPILWPLLSFTFGRDGDVFIGGATSAILLSNILFVVLSIIAVRWQVALPALVLEGLEPVQALRRSWHLVQNYWWRTVGLGLVLGILGIAISFGPTRVIVALAGLYVDLDPIARQIIESALTVITSALFVPVEFAAITLYYLDLRVRKEGFDLEIAIRRRYKSQKATPAEGKRVAKQKGNPVPQAPEYVPEWGTEAYEEGDTAVPTPGEHSQQIKKEWTEQARSRQRKDGPTHSNKPRKANIRHKAGKVGWGE